MKQPNLLARSLRAFFADYLPRVRGMSPHTICSYRDSFILLLRFLVSQKEKPASSLDFDDLGPEEVIGFLDHLEVTRKNRSSSRNVRLAAIRAFFRYTGSNHPERLEHCVNDGVNPRISDGETPPTPPKREISHTPPPW